MGTARPRRRVASLRGRAKKRACSACTSATFEIEVGAVHTAWAPATLSDSETRTRSVRSLWERTCRDDAAASHGVVDERTDSHVVMLDRRTKASRSSTPLISRSASELPARFLVRSQT
jgi:hypothetical protein